MVQARPTNPQDIEVAPAAPAQTAAPAPAPANKRPARTYTASAPTPPPTHEQLLEEYDVGDSSFDPDLDGEPPVREALVEPAAVNPSPPPASSPRRPDGTFASPRLVQMAKDLGIPEADATSMSSETLETTILHLNRLREDFRVAQRGQQNPAGVPPGTPAYQEGVDKGQETVPEGEYEDFDFETLKEEYNPFMLRVFREHQAAMKELRQIKQQLGQVTQFHQQQVQRAQMNALDRCFNKDPGIFGKGAASAIKADSIEGLKRMAAVDAMKRMASGTLEERYAIARSMFAGAAAPAPPASPAAPTSEPVPTNGTLTPEQQRWNDAALQRPTNRTSPPEPKGTRRAEKAAAAWIRENGQLLDEPGAEEAGLPD